MSKPVLLLVSFGAFIVFAGGLLLLRSMVAWAFGRFVNPRIMALSGRGITLVCLAMVVGGIALIAWLT